MHAWEHTRYARMAGPVGVAALTTAGIGLLSATGLGPGDRPWMGPLSAAFVLLSAGPFAAVYVLAAWGLGRPLAWLVARRSASRNWIQLALGLGLMLTVSHAIGVCGLLSAREDDANALAARVWAWAVAGVGLALLVDQVARGSLRPERWPVLSGAAAVWAPAMAIVLVAACNPPGALWRSEFGAYDALSYHLQLPKEWAAGDRLWPVSHNIYSYLPSYVEAAYLHLGMLMPGPADPVERMLGGEAPWIMACQVLHAAILVCAGALTGRVAAVACGSVGVPARRAAFLGVVAGALVVSVPWAVVVGSLAYTEAAVLAMLAGALLVAMDDGVPAWAQGAVSGFLVGIATSAKPTAAFLVAPAAGIVLLARTPARSWPAVLASGTVAGCAAVAPWLVRNGLACGNPVFPFAAERFGLGHWSLEQVGRYGGAHWFLGSPGERFGRLFSAEFGLAHEQWVAMPVLLGASIAGSLLWAPSRRLGAWLSLAVLAQCACWCTLTHLQSRFLIPVLVPAAVLFALLGAAMLSRFRAGIVGRGERSLVGATLVLAPLAAAAWGLLLFLSDGDWMPNRLLASGPAILTGQALEERAAIEQQKRQMSDEELRESLELNASPVAYINLIIRPQQTADAAVYLLGDGAPLYVLGASGRPRVEAGDGGAGASKARLARSPVLYHTTWDASPLGDAIRESPHDPRAWTDHLRSLGVRYVLADYAELTRLMVRDRIYDPAVTHSRIEQWTHGHGTGVVLLIRTWPAGQVVDAGVSYALYELRAPAPPTPTHPPDPGTAAKDAERP